MLKIGLRIVYGKAGSGKSSFCFSEIGKLIEKEKKILIITPEQFSFTAEKKLMQAVKKDAVINAEVITLSRMAFRILNEIGGASKTNLTKYGKAMLIFQILENNKKSLKYLNKNDENIEIVQRAITEFKKHNIIPEKIEEEITKIEDKCLKAKLKDMNLIYKSFEENIASKYIEDTDLLKILAQNIEKTSMIKDAVVYIDEFAGFTTQEYEVIAKIIKYAKCVTITMCVDELENNSNPDTDIFYSNKKTVIKLKNLINKYNLSFEEPVFLNKEYRFKNNELKHLEKNIYNIKSTKYEEKVENISLFLAKNQYMEIEEIAKKILKLVKNENFKYRDISIITKNIETYSSLIRAIFKKYEIPFFIDEKRDLNQNIIIQYILSILEIIRRFSNDNIFNYLKLGFSDIEKEEIFKLENYCAKWGIKDNKWKKEFNYGIEINEDKEEIGRLEQIRKQIINPLQELKSKIAKERTAENITKQLYDFIINQNIEEKIQIKKEELSKEGLIDLANEYEESYNIILDILDQMVLIFSKDKITIDKYSQILKVGLKNNGLGKIPGTQDQVIVGDVERSRSHKVKAIFIIGINDGVFPNINKDEGFFNDADRILLKQDDIELANGTIENIYEDNFNIYKAFTTAEEKLYLSYSSSDLDGKSLRPSILINKIKKLYPQLKEDSDIINKEYEIINKQGTYELLIEKISNLFLERKIEEEWILVYKYFKSQNEWNLKLKKDMEGLRYTNIPHNISQNKIDKLYGNTLKTSVSRLEKYSACPFSYYLKYGLRIKEKEELKVRSFNTGSFMHEVIDEFFKYINEEKLELPKLLENEEEIQKIVNNIVNNKLKLTQNYIFTATAKYKALVKRLKKVISKALKYIIEGLVNSDFNIEETELEFGKNKKYESIIMILESGKKVEITGKIDRIDTVSSEKGKYLRVIDYKSSAKNIDLNEVYAGLQIQLLTYTDAICKTKDLMPAGILYFGLLEQMIKADKKITKEEIEEEIRKNFKMKGLILADINVIKMQDRNLKTGSSKIIPAAITSSGKINQKWTNGVDSKEFKVLQDYIYKIIKQISKEILSGKIDLKPYNKDGVTPCKYCEYKAVCGFDTKNKDNKYNFIDKKSKDDVIKNMKNN